MPKGRGRTQKGQIPCDHMVPQRLCSKPEARPLLHQWISIFVTAPFLDKALPFWKRDANIRCRSGFSTKRAEIIQTIQV